MRILLGRERPLWPLLVSTVLGVTGIVILIIQIANPVGANDIWWHMLLGRHVLESGSLIIDHSIFTWTPATSYNVYNSWLADIILYLTYDHAGVVGLISLRLGVYFLIFYLAWRYAMALEIARNPLTWVIVLVAMTMIWPAHLIKPELFSIALFTIIVWLYFHIRIRGDQAWHLPYLFPLILAAWVNIHGAFFLSSIFFAATGIGELMNRRLCPSQAMSPKLQKHFFIALTLCLPAILISPFGYELPLTIIREVLANNDVNKYIVSYQPTFEFNGAPLYLLDYLLLAMLLFVLLLWQKLKNKLTDWSVILSFLGYCAIFTQLARVTYFLGPVFLFACLDLLAHKRDSWAWSTSRVAKSLLIALSISITTLIGFRTAGDNSCKLHYPLATIQHMFTVNKKFPITETEYIKKNLSGTKVGNVYQDGGYLLYHLWPQKLVMIDPRYFPFRSWLDNYFDFSHGTNITQFINSNPADYWLINYNTAGTFQWFYQSSDWNLALLGPTGGIFVPAGSRNENPTISPEIATMIGFGNMSPAFIVAIQMDDLTFARRIIEVVQTKLGSLCYMNAALIREMKETLAGFEAYNGGNYAEAARILEKKTWSIIALNKAKKALIILAEQAWKRGDISGARDWYHRALKIMPPKTITDVYNFALLDWLYHHAAKRNLEEANDGLNWQRFVDSILLQQDKIPQSQRHLIATVKAMKEGRFNGKGQLILSDGSLSPVANGKK